MRLVVVEPCAHGFIGEHDGYSSKPLEAGDPGHFAIDPSFRCPGGVSRTIEPPEDFDYPILVWIDRDANMAAALGEVSDE